MTPCPLNAKPIILVTAGTALAALPAVALGTAAVATGGLLGLKLGGKIEI